MAFWNRILELSGLGPSKVEKLDLAAKQMHRELGLRMELAGKSVALARTKQRELAQAVADYENLEVAAVQLRQQGRTDAVQYIAVHMAETQTRIETLTAELQNLNASASETVSTFESERIESEQLLRQHGQIKAAAQMNDELDKMQKEMKALNGASTAKSAYKALVNEVQVRTNEFRALAELESGGDAGKAVVQKALQQVRAQQMLELIEKKANSSLPGTIQGSLVMENAQAALMQDPIRGALPTHTVANPSENDSAQEMEIVEDKES